MEGGVLRAGAVEAPPWVELEDGEPTGIEPALVESFARSVGARVDWTTGWEEELVGAMREGVHPRLPAHGDRRGPPHPRPVAGDEGRLGRGPPEPLPPIAFLVAARIRERPATERFPWGLHRAPSIAYLAAAIALLLFGGYVLVDSLMKLARLEHPPIGTVVVFGEQVWQGWLMLGALA